MASIQPVTGFNKNILYANGFENLEAALEVRYPTGEIKNPN
jgi:hypothetical protein